MRMRRSSNAILFGGPGMLAVLVAVLAFAGAGCSWAPDDSRPARIADDGDVPASAAPSDGDGTVLIQDPPEPGDPEPGDTEPDDTEPAPPPRSDEDDDRSDRDLIDEVVRQQRERLAELTAASRWTMERARQFVSDGRIDRARTLLTDLLAQLRRWQDVDEGLGAVAADVEGYLDEIRGLGGEGFGPADTRSASDARAGLIEEAKAEARRHIENADAHADAGEFEAALREYELVNDVIRWAPLGARLDETYSDAVDGRIRQTREAIRQAQFEARRSAQATQHENEILDRQRSEAARIRTLEELWGEALFNMNLRRFGMAEGVATHILALDPGFDRARVMIQDIGRARSEARRDENVQRRIDQYRRLWADWYEAKTPLQSIIEYPTGDEWEQIKARAGRLRVIAEEPPAVMQIRSVLENTVADRLDYDETPLKEVLEDVSHLAGLPIAIHPSIAEDFGDEEVTLNVSNVLWGNALNIICELLECDYIVVPEGVGWITTDDVELEPQMVVKLHDVRDLTIRVRDFAGTRIRLRGNDSGGSGGSGLIFEDDEELVEQVETDTLAEIIEEIVLPNAWDDGFIQTLSGHLFVRNTPDVHAQIARFLQDLRDVSGLVITIEARFITVEDLYLSNFGVDWRGLGGQSPGNTVLLDDVTVDVPDLAGGTVDNGANAVPPGAATAGVFFNSGVAGTTTDVRGRFENIFENALGNFLRTTGGLGLQFTVFADGDKQFQAVVDALEKRRNATVLIAPRLSAFNTQRANLTVINQVAYIRDFSIQTAVSAAIADPIIDTISDGLVLDIKPTVSNDRRFITIELRPSIAQLLRPIPEFTTTLGAAGSTPVTIQIPELSVQSAETTVMCPDGGLVVVGGLKSIRDVDRESTTPLLGDIPILGMLFKRKGRSLENRSLIIVVKAMITDLREQESRRQ